MFAVVEVVVAAGADPNNDLPSAGVLPNENAGLPAGVVEALAPKLKPD
jgi:hypothetical protein